MTPSPETDAVADPARPRAAQAADRPRGAHGWWLLLLLIAAAGWYAWHARSTRQQTQLADSAAQWQALSARVYALRADQRAQAQRLQQADATNRILRDELLGLGQRAALLEDSVTKLADPHRLGAQALRLDEVELLLEQGLQRLQQFGDLAGARRAYALAGGVLDGVDDPAWLNLRQTLAQERAALDALGTDPKVRAAGQLDLFAAGLAAPVAMPAADPRDAGAWWQRAFANLLQVRRSDHALLLAPSERAAGLAALQLELALARAACERRDVAGWRATLARADAWLPRLWADAPTLRRQRAQLQALRGLPLTVSLPTLGSTLQQLRQTRVTR